MRLGSTLELGCIVYMCRGILSFYTRCRSQLPSVGTTGCSTAGNYMQLWVIWHLMNLNGMLHLLFLAAADILCLRLHLHSLCLQCLRLHFYCLNLLRLRLYMHYRFLFSHRLHSCISLSLLSWKGGFVVSVNRDGDER